MSIVTQVNASFGADDGSRTIAFDAGPYMEQASWGDLSELVGIGFGGDYAADAVARWTANSDILPYGPRLADAIDDVTVRDVGFEVHIDVDHALGFLAETRPVFLLFTVFTRIAAEDDQTRLGQVTDTEIARILSGAFSGSPQAENEAAAHVQRIVYELAFTLGPETALTGLLTQSDLATALGRAVDHADRAKRYQAAGIPVQEARAIEADAARRPTDDALDVLAALRGTTAT